MEGAPPGPTDFDLLAASLRADATDLGTFLEVLATKLGQALPGHVTVKRDSGLFRRQAQVKLLALNLGDRRYELARGQTGIEARIAHSVRGVTLKTEPVALETWIGEVSAGLAVMAQATAQGRAAVQRLLG